MLHSGRNCLYSVHCELDCDLGFRTRFRWPKTTSFVLINVGHPYRENAGNGLHARNSEWSSSQAMFIKPIVQADPDLSH